MSTTNGTVVGATLLVSGLGLVTLAGGALLFVRSRWLERRCTGNVTGAIYDIVDEDFKFGRSRLGRAAKEEPVVAANEAIAAKKRAYQAKKRAQAELEARSATATWRPMVRYEVDGTVYEVRADRGVCQDRFRVGQACEVHYDPARPSRHWLAIDGLPRTFGALLMLCGAALILVGIAFWFVLPAISELAGEV